MKRWIAYPLLSLLPAALVVGYVRQKGDIDREIQVTFVQDRLLQDARKLRIDRVVKFNAEMAAMEREAEAQRQRDLRFHQEATRVRIAELQRIQREGEERARERAAREAEAQRQREEDEARVRRAFHNSAFRGNPAFDAEAR